MRNQSATFTGPTEKELPFSITGKEYEEVENQLKDEILKLINLGVTTFYASGEAGINTTCAQLVIYLRDEMNYDIKLFPVVTANSITKDYSQRQIDDYEWIRMKATMSITYHNKITKRTIRIRNRYVMKQSGHLIAIWDGEKKGNVWNMIKMAKRRKMHINSCIQLST